MCILLLLAQLLTLDDCVRLAERVQSALTSSQYDVQATQLGVRAARAGFLPQAQYANGFTYNSPRNGEFSFVALNGIHEYSSQVVVGQEFDTSGRLRAALGRARADRAAANASLAITGRDLKRSVAMAYYQLLLARKLAQANRTSLDEALSFERRTRQLVGGGEAAQADVVKAASQVAFLDQAQRAAELEAEIANHDLASFWTEDTAARLEIEDIFDKDLPPPDTGPATSGAFLGRPEFRLFEAQKQGFLFDSKQARANLLPQLSANFQYGIDALRLSWSERGYASFISLNIPVFDWFRSRSEQQAFQLRARQVEATRSAAARSFSREYESALARVRLVYEQIALTRAQVKLSAENLRLSRLRYEGGEGPALDVVAAQSQLAQARTNYYTAISGYLNARADLSVARGQ